MTGVTERFFLTSVKNTSHQLTCHMARPGKQKKRGDGSMNLKKIKKVPTCTSANFALDPELTKKEKGKGAFR